MPNLRKVWRPVGLTLGALGATWFFLAFVHRLYPIQRWLFWHYFQAAALSSLFVLACISAGFLTLRLVLKRPLPIAEHFSVAFAIGAYEFFVLMFLGGLLGLFGSAWFVILPLAMLASGAWPLFRYARRLRRHLLAQRKRAQPLALGHYAILAFGLMGLAMIYFLILTPDNVSYDSRWQHLGLAEHYAAAGRIAPSPEGSYTTAAPHLAALLYSWTMQMPNSMLFDRIELAAHLEFACFLLTLVGVSALARRLVGLPRPRHAWVARFLFPGVLLYDSSLSAGADHVAAIFAAPIFLMLLRYWQEPRWRWIALLVTVIVGAAMTKYTGALLLIVFPLLVVPLRALVELWRRVRKRPGVELRPLFASLGVALGLGLVVSAPHWLKNWIWYSDPLYPLFYKYLPLHPWTEGTAIFLRGYMGMFWRPEANLEGLLESLKVLFTWAFVPNDWPQFHGKWPVFGALFSIGLVLLPFLRGTRRIWALYAAVHVGIFSWYWVHHQDRYLQAAMPLIAGGTAAVLTLAWRHRWPVKTGVAALLVASILWGGDVYFIQTHAMIGSPHKYVLDLLAKGYKREYEQRFQIYGPLYRMSKALPKDAVVLMHELRPRLGLRRPTIQDNAVTQGGLRYGELDSPRAVWEKLDGMGVTHLMWDNQKSYSDDTLGGDLVFFHFALFAAERHERFDHYVLAGLPVEPPSVQFDDRVLVLGCATSEYRPGLYRLEQLDVPPVPPLKYDPPLPKPDPAIEITQQTYQSFVGQVGFVVFDRNCHDGSALKGHPEYALAAKRRTLELWIRKPVGR